MRSILPFCFAIRLTSSQKREEEEKTESNTNTPWNNNNNKEKNEKTYLDLFMQLSQNTSISKQINKQTYLPIDTVTLTHIHSPIHNAHA